MQEPVYVLHLITCHGRIMPSLAELLLFLYQNIVAEHLSWAIPADCVDSKDLVWAHIHVICSVFRCVLYGCLSGCYRAKTDHAA